MRKNRRKTWVVVPKSPIDRVLTWLERFGWVVALVVVGVAGVWVAGLVDTGCGGLC